MGHLTELMGGKYGEIVELWLDGQWDKTRKQWQLDRIYDAVKRMQPKCQIGVNGTVGVDDDRAVFPDEYYLPFEMTICSREGRWFYSDTYEKCRFVDAEAAAADCQRAFDERNIAVINMPPNNEGRLVEGDITHLMEIAERLKCRRQRIIM